MRATPIKDEIYDSRIAAERFSAKNKLIEQRRLKDGWRWVEVVENNVKTLVFRKL